MRTQKKSGARGLRARPDPCDDSTSGARDTSAAVPLHAGAVAGHGCTWSAQGGARMLSERRLAFLRDGLVLVLEQFIDAGFRDDAINAYDCGLASGFYGKQAAIAAGHRRWMAARVVALRGAAEEARERLSMMDMMLRTGTQHGHLLRTESLAVCLELESQFLPPVGRRPGARQSR